METSSVIAKSDGELISSSTDDSAAFSDVETVAKGWMLDFLFISACRFFKEDRHLEFNRSLQSLEAILEGCDHLKKDQKMKMDVCMFLSRIVHGKHIDVQFENEEEVTPLLSALRTWESFSDVVPDKVLYEKIQKLLFIQSVGVCLEKGNHTIASWVLDKLEEQCDIPETLKMKLALIVKKNDAYQQFCSFNHLVKSVKSFLDWFLSVHPSDFLLKAATVVALSCGEEETKDPNESGSTIQDEEGLKKSCEASELPALPKWTWEEDKNLKAGVRRYGEGRWTQILENFDFPGRTSVMLKDRWRTLKKLKIVN
ncbi:telomeric repeat-binding factor 1 [Megalops cyprinoides]|uniref:telomeric repeat-binding factor 1 n=1 Tax=Megalops cyprinoides TaxID=118141 RepID=UPI0018647BDE|nr:telomeric repeat-binding factor 1 [Megalops cyprinoides]